MAPRLTNKIAIYGWSTGRPGEQYLSLPVHDPLASRTSPSRGSGIQWLPERTPPFPEVLDDLARLLVANLDKFLAEVPVLPLDNRRSKRPAEILPQALVGETVSVELKSAHQSVRIVDSPVAADDGVESDLIWH
jgi:hypothetical protein